MHWNLGVATLYEEAMKRGEGVLSVDGRIVCSTAPYTGRSPNDKFIVAEGIERAQRRLGQGQPRRSTRRRSTALFARMQAYAAGKELFVQDCYAGADPAYRLPIRVITEKAWHSLFARHMFIPETDAAEARRSRSAVHGDRLPELHGQARDGQDELRDVHPR